VGTGRLALAGRAVGSGLSAPGLWFYDTPAQVLGADPDVASALVAPFTAVAVWAAGWLVAGLARRRGASVRSLLAVGTVWTLPLLLAPPLFSPDVYAYTAIGAAIQHGVDPYLHGPGAAGDIAAVRGAEPFWRDSPTPYGPPFLALLSLLSRLFDEDLLSVLLALRVLSVAAMVTLAFSVVGLARRWGVDPARAVWLGVVNPLVLVHAVSANHNDVLMLALVLPGLLLASSGRPLWGAVLCGAAAGIKVTALVVVLAIGVEHARRQRGWWRRLRALLAAGVVGTGTFVVLAEAAGYGWGWLANLSVPGRAVVPLTPSTALAIAVDAGHPPLHAVRLVVSGVGAILCLLLLTALPRWGLARVTGWLLLVVVAVGPVVWPWYLMAPIMVFATSGERRERQVVVLLSVVMLFVLFPGGRPTLVLLGSPQAEWLVLGALAALLLGYGGLNLVDSVRFRSRLSLADTSAGS
jgi:alpha-1,6-mannosyltransferase